jgi:hypothetical protein
VAAMAKVRFPNLPSAVVDAAVRRMLQSNTFPRSAITSESGWQKAIALRLDSGDLRDPKKAAGILWRLSSN